MGFSTGAALSSTERRSVAALAAIYATRMFGLFLLLPVLALHAGSLPGGTPLLAGLAVGAYGLAQAVMQIPFGAWSDRYGRKPLIVVGLVLHIAGSLSGAYATTALALVWARALQGLGAVSGPVMALLADQTRPGSRTRAMAAIGIGIGASFVLSLIGGPLIAGVIGVDGLFLLIGVMGAAALALVRFAVPAETPRRLRARSWRAAMTRRLLPQYAGVFVLHLSLTACFIAVPFALRDLHGIPVASHWQVYLAVFAASFALTIPLILWSERARRPDRVMLAGGLLLAAALSALAWTHADLRLLAVSLTFYFGAFNFLEARLPASLADAAGESARGAAMGVFSTCQFAGAFAGGAIGGALLGSPLALSGIFAFAALASAAWLPQAGRSELRRMGPKADVPAPGE
ncbi:MAG: MFS transporter [Steroidobacteraceae bacterium]